MMSATRAKIRKELDWIEKYDGW